MDSFGALFERDAVSGMTDALARLQHILVGAWACVQVACRRAGLMQIKRTRVLG